MTFSYKNISDKRTVCNRILRRARVHHVIDLISPHVVGSFTNERQCRGVGESTVRFARFRLFHSLLSYYQSRQLGIFRILMVAIATAASNN